MDRVNGYTSSVQNPPAIAPLGTTNQGTCLQVWVNGCASEEAVYINVLAQPDARLVRDPHLRRRDPTSSRHLNEYAWTLADGTVVTTIAQATAHRMPTDQSGAYALSVFDGTCWSAIEAFPPRWRCKPSPTYRL